MVVSNPILFHDDHSHQIGPNMAFKLIIGRFLLVKFTLWIITITVQLGALQEQGPIQSLNHVSCNIIKKNNI